jgi:gas vesicle structural protein
VVAGVDTYLRFAEAVKRLDLSETQVSGIPELMENLTESGEGDNAKEALESTEEKVSDLLGGDEDKEDQEQERGRSNKN